VANTLGLQQILRTQGIQWGDSGRSGLGDFHLWFDAGGTLYTDAVWNAQGGSASIAPDGATSGATGKGFVYTTGAGGGGNSRGGDFTINLGNGTGTKKGGSVNINNTTTAPESDVTPALFIQTAYTPSQAGSSVQCIQANLTTSGDATLVTGPSVAAIEMAHIYTATGVIGSSIIYGSESQMLLNHASGTVNTAVGFQANIRGTGAGTLTAGAGLRVAIGPFTGVVTTMNAVTLGPMDLSGAATGVTNYRGVIANDTYNTSGGSNTSGGFSCINILACVPSQGGHTSGTNNNIAFQGSITQPNSGGGVPGVGGTSNNTCYEANVPTAGGPGSGAGFTYNIGVHIKGNGNGGTQGAGFANDWALASVSTAPSIFVGRVGIGSTFSTATAPATNSTFHIVATKSIVSGAGAIWKGVNIAASTVTMTGTTNVTTATGFNLIEIAAPIISWGTANSVARSASLAILGPPGNGGSSAILTTVYSLDVQTGNVFLGGLITTYNNIPVGGNGIPSLVKVNRPAQQVNATVTLATYTVGAADGSFLISANVNVTVSTTVTMTVTCAYTDEANVARTLTIPFLLLSGVAVQSITTAQGNIAYESSVYHIRCKTGTTITIATAGTVTAVTYTGEGIIQQVA
jgi:hypothetical protein